MRIVVVLTLLAGSAMGQSFSVGVKAGVPFTDFFNSVSQGSTAAITDNRRFLIGPTVEFHLPFGFSIEGDAIYRRIGYKYLAGNSGGLSTSSGNSWQFPILAKKTILPLPFVKPYVDGGVSFQKITGLSVSTLLNTPIATTATNDFVTGFTLGAGVQLKLGRFRIEPELRYTRWGSNVFKDPFSALLNSNQNQRDFLVGFTF